MTYNIKKRTITLEILYKSFNCYIFFIFYSLVIYHFILFNFNYYIFIYIILYTYSINLVS